MLLKSLQSSVPTMKSVNPCCVLGGGSRSRLCNQSASVVRSGEAVAIGCVCWGRFEGGRVRGKGRGRSRIRLDIGPIRSILGLACDLGVLLLLLCTRENHSAFVLVCSGKAVGLLRGGSDRLPRTHGPAGPCHEERRWPVDSHVSSEGRRPPSRPGPRFCSRHNMCELRHGAPRSEVGVAAGGCFGRGARENVKSFGQGEKLYFRCGVSWIFKLKLIRDKNDS
jgi:hypothetical protein